MKTQLLLKSWFKRTVSFIVLLLICTFSGCDILSDLKIEKLRTEYRSNPLGIDNTAPRLSWQLIDESHTRDQQQTAYQILLASSLKELENNIGDVWNSEKITSSQSVNVVYDGAELQSSKQYFWKVKTWDKDRAVSKWITPAHFSMGLIQQSDWKGDWILKADQEKIEHNWYRKNFELKENAESAFVFVGSVGYHELYVNGEKVTENVMNLVSSYMKKRISYLTYNVAGGRWVTVHGLKYTPKLQDAKGYVVTNDRKQISKFESSSEQLNQIYQVNLNTYLANTMDGILLDCPHRERRGWGEVTVTAMYGDALPNFESGAYMDQYLQYTRDAQLSDGQTRAVINEEDRPFLMWKANNPLTLWETYRMLGDKKVLEDNYQSMQKWMTWLYEHSNANTGGALKIGEQGKREMPELGDWCTPRGNFWTSSNSPDAAHFNNCLYAFMLDNAMQIAEALGKDEDVKTYKERLKVQREATHKLSYNPETGKYLKGYQVDQAFALLSGVTPASEKAKVEASLADNVLYKFPYYDTGSSGQALYTRYFTESGERMDLVYELLQDKHHPSYGYFLEQGKIVWPERWSAIGNSQIHTCYTGIGGYFIKGFGGIRPDPERLGMQHMIIKPALVGDLTFANTEYKSTYGNVVVNWKKENNGASFHIEVPINTTAKVYLPAVDKNVVKDDEKLLENSDGVIYIGTEKNAAVGNYIIYKLPSGIYDFTVSQLPETSLPNPIQPSNNLATIGRMNASSMFIQTEKLPVFEAFRANDEDEETRWLATETNNQYLEVEWVKPQTFNQVIVDEYNDAITAYKLQYLSNGAWKSIAKGTTCGANKIHQFNSIQTKKLRLYIEEAKQAPSIKNIKIYNKNKQ